MIQLQTADCFERVHRAERREVACTGTSLIVTLQVRGNRRSTEGWQLLQGWRDKLKEEGWYVLVIQLYMNHCLLMSYWIQGLWINTFVVNLVGYWSWQYILYYYSIYPILNLSIFVHKLCKLMNILRPESIRTPPSIPKLRNCCSSNSLKVQCISAQDLGGYIGRKWNIIIHSYVFPGV